MDLQQFLSRPSASFSGAFKSRHFNQNLSDEVRELAHRGLKLFPVSLAAKLNDCPDELISAANRGASLASSTHPAAQGPKTAPVAREARRLLFRGWSSLAVAAASENQFDTCDLEKKCEPTLID